MKGRICFMLAMLVGMAAKADVITNINSIPDLQALEASVNEGDNYSGVTVTLNTDLNLSDVNWNPIGTALHPFT